VRRTTFVNNFAIHCNTHYSPHAAHHDDQLVDDAIGSERRGVSKRLQLCAVVFRDERKKERREMSDRTMRVIDLLRVSEQTKSHGQSLTPAKQTNPNTITRAQTKKQANGHQLTRRRSRATRRSG
jgi:hypothetical protein